MSLHKRIIVVRGKGNIGKTSSIKIIFDLLKKCCKNARINNIHSGSDICVIIEINGVKIGIESQGDPNSRLEDSLEELVEQGCRIIICATRTRGGTCDAVEEYKGQYNIDWRDKKEELDEAKHTRANEIFAKKIFEEIKKLLDIECPD